MVDVLQHARTLALLGALGACFVPSSSSALSDTVSPDCTLNGFKLHGKIKVVENFPDLKVKVVEHFPDLKVQTVSNFPDKCGKWKMVENFPDVKIQFVQNFPDLKIKFVENFPGIP
jgi:hypothetical protein